jgi:hypothetical protein
MFSGYGRRKESVRLDVRAERADRGRCGENLPRVFALGERTEVPEKHEVNG